VRDIRYWWVNNKQTFKKELEGQYIWAPQTKSNGQFNQTYANLMEVSIGDLIFAYANASIKAIGVIEENCIVAPKPEFGKAGDRWSQEGFKVKVNWHKLQIPFRPKEHLASIAPLLPAKHAPIRSNGDGNEGCYLASISKELGELLVALLSSNDLLLVDVLLEFQNTQVKNNLEESNILKAQIPETEKSQLIKARIGQGVFRQNVLKIEKKCRITKLEEACILVASHIKPWKDSDNSERLEGHNGLLLSPHVDKLFDLHWISFANSGNVLVRNESVRRIMREWKIEVPPNVGAFNARQSFFLEHHRTEFNKSLT
jgi:putative restriction endonuclease